MNRLVKIAAYLATAVAVIGCEGIGREDSYTNDQPLYRQPQLPDTQVAALNGTWGTFIESVDDVSLPKEKTYFPAFTGGIGGNRTTVLPGPRKLQLYVTYNDEYYRTAFTFEFQPGHAYELCRAVNVYDETIRIQDKTTGDIRYIRAG